MANPSRQSTTACATDARALYLGSKGRKQVSCTDQALVVTNAQAQTYRYPLARVARVVSSPVVDWSGAALTLCLRAGISITWTDSRGQSLGAGYPQRRDAQGAATVIEMLVETPGGFERYLNWQRARRMDILTRWALSGETVCQPAQWEAAKRQWVHAGQYAAHLPPALRGLVLALVVATLARHGLPPMMWDHEARPVNLDETLCELLWAEMNLCTGNLPDHSEAERPLTELFERWAACNAAALLTHLHSLERLAQKAVYE